LIGCRNCDIFFIFHLIGNLFLFKSILVVNLKKKQVSQSGWPLQNIYILKWQWIFYFLRRCFLSPITAKTFTGTDCIYMSSTDGVL
jgi:hypothetical protein